jgi:hypothetical protein
MTGRKYILRIHARRRRREKRVVDPIVATSRLHSFDYQSQRLLTIY